MRLDAPRDGVSLFNLDPADNVRLREWLDTAARAEGGGFCAHLAMDLQLLQAGHGAGWSC